VPNLERRTEREAQLLDLVERVRERAPTYFPGIGGGARVQIRARWQRAYSDLYRLTIIGDTPPLREVMLKIFADAETQYRAMVMAWPKFAQHQTLRIPRPVDYLPEGPAIVMEAVDGRSLQERLPRVDWFGRRTKTGEGDCHRAGQWLSFYHGPGPLAGGYLEVDRKLEDFRAAAQRLADVGIGQRNGTTWVDRLRDDGEKLRSRLLPISRVHGDFTIDNVLLNGSCVTGLDVWATDTNVIYHDLASFLNSLLLLRCTRLLSQVFLSRLRSAFLRGYFSGARWDEVALTFLQRVGLADVALEILGRRTSAFSRRVVTHVIATAMEGLTDTAREHT
jgi:phosphotransferase family enzyme